MSPQLSTTGYAVLGLLALRPLTPYEIAQQQQRSLDYCWPTSERSLYDQPERLVAAGYAQREAPDAGKPAKYSITEAGRAALREWLSTATAMPRFQNEPLLRMLFADQASPVDLANMLAALKAHAHDRRREGIEQMTPYLSGDGLFQERAHIVVLTGELIRRLLNALDDWADLVAEATAEWTTTDGIGLDDNIKAILEAFIEDGVERINRVR